MHEIQLPEDLNPGETSLTPPATEQDDLVEQPKRGRGRSKKTAAEKVGGSDDPFAGTDIPLLVEDEQNARDGVAWPFPGPNATHDEGEPPIDDEPAEQTDSDEA